MGVSQRPLTLILLQKYRDTNARRIVIQIGGVYTTFCQEEGILCKSIAIEMGGVSRYFANVSGSGVDVTLLISVCVCVCVSSSLVCSLPLRADPRIYLFSTDGSPQALESKGDFPFRALPELCCPQHSWDPLSFFVRKDPCHKPTRARHEKPACGDGGSAHCPCLDCNCNAIPPP